jgi:hypothetical protein
MEGEDMVKDRILKCVCCGSHLMTAKKWREKKRWKRKWEGENKNNHIKQTKNKKDSYLFFSSNSKLINPVGGSLVGGLTQWMVATHNSELVSPHSGADLVIKLLSSVMASRVWSLNSPVSTHFPLNIWHLLPEPPPTHSLLFSVLGPDFQVQCMLCSGFASTLPNHAT